MQCATLYLKDGMFTKQPRKKKTLAGHSGMLGVAFSLINFLILLKHFDIIFETFSSKKLSYVGNELFLLTTDKLSLIKKLNLNFPRCIGVQTFLI